MKDINTYLTEAVKDIDKGIIDMLKLFSQSCDGYQKELYTQKAKDADSIDIVPLEEVFTKEEIQEIKKRVQPQPRCCYENAWKLCDRFEYEGNHKIEYCEGYMNFRGLPIEHAFNKVDGKYVDITVELALKRKIEDTYIVVGEYDTDKVREILVQNGFYGNIYDTIFLNNYKEKISKVA